MPTDYLPRIKDVLRDLAAFSQFGGIYFSLVRPGPPVFDKGVCRFCSGCLRHSRAGGLCQNNAFTAAVQGHAIGDAWYCRCWLGVDCFVVPVAPENEIIGAIEVGGFFSPGESDKTTQKILSRLASVDSLGTLGEFVSALQGMRELQFMQVKAAADFVLEATFAAGLNPAALFGVRHKIFQQQQRLAQKLQRTRQASRKDQNLLFKLNRIVKAMDSDDRARALQMMDDFLSHLLLTGNNDLGRIKAGLLAYLAVLSHYQAHHGGSWAGIIGQFEENLLHLDQMKDVESAFFWAENLLQTRAIAIKTPKSEAARLPPRLISDKLLAWLRTTYANNISLADAAHAVNASRSSVVHRLKAETGKTFAEHLSSARICEAKRLLAYTTLSLGEIARRCGFKDQSYFTKVFRRQINLTPREFRRLLINQAVLPGDGGSEVVSRES